MKIKQVKGEVIHDSRGDNTVQVTIVADNGVSASAAVPSGASKSSYEAAVIEPLKSVEIIESELEKLLLDKDPINQKEIDDLLIKQDGTTNKSRIGANTILGISLAVSRLAAKALNKPLYRYLGELVNRRAFFLPIPMMNLINGGKHADNNLDIQEFMIIPDRIKTYHEQFSTSKHIFQVLGRIMRRQYPFVPTGDEGGYAPTLDTNEMALDYLVQAIKEAGNKPWDEVSLGLDVAASSLPPTFEVTPQRFLGLMKDFPILSIEDPFAEDDWGSWAKFHQEMEESNVTDKKLMLVGDDLFGTNPNRLRHGVNMKAANAILVKLNQIGTLSETLTVVEIARSAGYFIVVSHRSGETLDDYIADFAVGIGAQFIKAGAPNDNHPERMSKYHRLLAIEKELGVNNTGSE